MDKRVFLSVCVGLAMAFVSVRAAGGPLVDPETQHAQVRPVQSKAEFSRYLSAHPDFALHKLPPEAVENFVESLVFTPRGIGSYSYLGLSVFLTEDEIRQVLRVIGAEETIGAIPTIAQTKSFGGRGGAVVMSDVCEDPNSPLCQSGSGKAITDSVCSSSWPGEPEKCGFSVGDICPSTCGK